MDTLPGAIDVPAGWVAVLRESRSAVERGDVVPSEPVLERMRAAIERIEQRQVSDAQDEA